MLRNENKEADLTDKEALLKLIEDMKDTLKVADGCGLAAPQVGILKRVVVIDIGEGLVELINPVILETSGSQTDDEGCLSVPGKYAPVERPNYVKVKFMDRNGDEYIIEGEELMARALCHEIDHLDGVLYIDKAQRMLTPEEMEQDEE